jgi:hypothetical protein
MINDPDQVPSKQSSHRVLLGLGACFILFAAILAARITWEETLLTLHEGPQMVGFSLAHGSAAILLIAPLMLALWLVVTLVIMTLSLVRKRHLSKPFWSTLAAALLVLGVLSIPGEFWQWMFAGTFAKSTHAADLMTYDAAEGCTRTVRAYLAHGVPLESRNYEGSTAAFTAAAGDSLPVLQLLASKGADLSAINSYGDSPLEVAVEHKNDAVAAFLREHGAKQIQGTPEQRQAATEAIVRKDIERLDSEETKAR